LLPKYNTQARVPCTGEQGTGTCLSEKGQTTGESTGKKVAFLLSRITIQGRELILDPSVLLRLA
jgi:hypothetical protein